MPRKPKKATCEFCNSAIERTVGATWRPWTSKADGTVCPAVPLPLPGKGHVGSIMEHKPRVEADG